MNSASISPNSWHFRLATVYGPLDSYRTKRDGTDLCTYVRAALLGLVFVLLITTVAGAYAAGIGDAAAWLVAGMLHGFVQINETGGMSLALTGAVLVLMVGGFIWYVLYDLSQKRKERIRNERYAMREAGEEPPISFFESAYDSFKNKYCLMLNFRSAEK